MILVFPFTATHITIVAIVSDYLLSFVRNTGTHGGQPFEGVKDLLFFSIPRLVNDFELRDICHPLLGETPPAQNSRRDRKARII